MHEDIVMVIHKRNKRRLGLIIIIGFMLTLLLLVMRLIYEFEL